ncbi:MAG: GDP-mannose 4,6-dehydratase, partial [Nitrospirae bacterium]|nr:GDP-mannose 4,6-dehydratase [Nitrospirota bacterium]
MENILVTGAAGFIGSHLTERLLAHGYRILGLDNFDPFFDPATKRNNVEIFKNHPQFSMLEGDIRDISFLKEIFSRYPIDKIIHLAARAGVRPSIQDPSLYDEVNVRGTLNLLELSKEKQIRQFVFASSSSVYGGNKKIPFSEGDPVDSPVSPYAVTKKAGELLCYNYHHLFNIPMTCLRFFTVYGPRQRPEMAIHLFARAILEGKNLPLYGDGTTRRDFTYIEDIIDGIVLALEKTFDYEIFNLGESVSYPIMEVIQLLSKLIGKPAHIQHLPFQPGDMLVTYADISKARDRLKYEPRTPLEKGLEIFVKQL